MAADDGANELSEDKPSGGRRGKLKPLIIVGALMLGEGVGIFAMMKFFAGPPESTLASEDDAEMEDPLNLGGQTEVELCEVDAFNRKEGKLHVYSMKLSAMVAAEDAESVAAFVEARAASISDRVQLVIRSADPQHLNDPSLEMVKRQIKQELNNLIGKELIEELLVSKLLQSRTNL